jgi:hypothetical protein
VGEAQYVLQVKQHGLKRERERERERERRDEGSVIKQI